MAAASKLDVDHLFKRIGEKLGWFKYGDLDSAIQSLSKSAKAKSTKTRLCIKKTIKKETDPSNHSTSSGNTASTKKIQKADLKLADSSSHSSDCGDEADLLPKKTQANDSSTKIPFSDRTSTKKIQKARLILDDSSSHSSDSSDEADLFSCKTKGNGKNNIISNDVSKEILHGKKEVGVYTPRHSKKKEKCSMVMKSKSAFLSNTENRWKEKANGQMLKIIGKKKLVEDSLRQTDEFIAPQECKKKTGYCQQSTLDTEKRWTNSQFELSSDLEDFGDPLKESTRIHRRSSVTYHKILNVSGISSANSSSMDDQESSDSVFQSDDSYKQIPQRHSIVGKSNGCDYQKFLVPSNGDIVQILDNITLEEFHTVNETKDVHDKTSIRLHESVIKETVDEVSKDEHFVTVKDSLLEEENSVSCSGSSTHRIRFNFNESSSKQSFPGVQIIPDSESENDNKKDDILFRKGILGQGRQLLLNKNGYLRQEESKQSTNISGHNYNSSLFSQDHKTQNELLPDISLPKVKDNDDNLNVHARKLSEKKTREDFSSSLDSHKNCSQSGNESCSTEMQTSVDSTCSEENGSLYEVADVSIQCHISCKSLDLSPTTSENFKDLETCHASSQISESHSVYLHSGDNNIVNNTSSTEDNTVDSAYEVVDASIQTDYVNKDEMPEQGQQSSFSLQSVSDDRHSYESNYSVNDEDESLYEVVDVSVQTVNSLGVTENSDYHKRELNDDNVGSAKLLNNNSPSISRGLHGSNSNNSAKRLETGLSSVISAESHDYTSMRTPDENLKQTSSLNLEKKQQNVLHTSNKSKKLQIDTQQNYKRNKAQANETIYFDAVSDTDQVELPSTEVENNLPEEDGSDLKDGERRKIGYDSAEEDDAAPNKNSCRGVVIQPSADENKSNWRARRGYDSESSDDGLEAFFQKLRTPKQSERDNSSPKESRNSLKDFIVDDDEEISGVSDEEDELFYISTTRALETPLRERIKSKLTSFPSATSDGSDGDFSSSVYHKSVTKHKRKNATKASKSTKSVTRQKKSNWSSSSNDSYVDTEDSKHPRSSLKSSLNVSDVDYSDENFTEETFNKLKQNNTADSVPSSIPDAVLKPKVVNTFVTPKPKSAKTPGVKNLKTPSLLTPKVPACSDFTPKKTSAADGTLGFLQSLSSEANDYRRHSDAVRFITSFKKYKEELSSKLFTLFNETVFDGQLPSDLPVIWNKRLLRTAGYCAFKFSASSSQAQRSARIELSTKVCDSAERVRDTLIHEMCHAAVWLLNGAKDGHGPYWKYWAKKANMAHPEIPVVARCHNYSISTKFIYRCTKCGYSIGRHSKSLDTERKVCGYCHGNFELLSNKSTSSTPSVSGWTPAPVTPRAPNRFAMFVKENYNEVKKTDKCLKHGDVMKILSKQFAEMKMNLE